MVKNYLLTFGALFYFHQAQAGVEAAQLDYVALDSSIECNRILFQSSQHFKKTLFVIPRVVPGTGVEGARTYNIKPTSKAGIYNLEVNLYFPASDEILKTSSASSYKKDLFACNWDKVKFAINKNITDPSLKIQTIARIPLTSIEVKIPGIKNIGLIGKSIAANEESDILDYYGKSLTAQFQITESEKNLFQSQLVSTDGLSGIVKFRFQARSRNGSVRAKINLENLAQNFSAQASAKGLKFMGSADIAATLKSSVTDNSIQVTSESGSSDDIPKMTALIVDKVLKEIGFALGSVALPETEKAKSGSGQISISAVVDILKTKVSSEVSFNLVTAPENASAQTELKLRADKLNDPNIIEMILSAGYQAPSMGVEIKAGETITINPAYWYTDKIEYSEQRAYLTTGEIQSLNLANHFDDLVNKNITINDVEINGTLLAEGQWRPFLAIDKLASPHRTRWARVQKIATRLRESSGMIPAKLAAFEQLPVYFTFSELGNQRFFKLSELVEDNPYWSAQYEEITGRLIFTAKKNLGTIRLRDRMYGKENIKTASVILDQVFQEKISYFGARSYTSNVLLRQDESAITWQKSIVFFLTRPQVLTSVQLKNLKPLIKDLDLNIKP